MTRRSLSWLLVLLVSFCWLVPAQAQEEENDGVAELVMIQAKEGQGPALIEAITDFHHWVADKEGSFRYSWYQVETGPNTGDYIARTGDHDWSDFDAEYDWQEEANEKFMADVAPLVHHVERILTVEMKEFAYWPEDFSGYTLFQVENWYVKNGQYGKFRAGLEKIHKILSENNFGQPYGFHSTRSGGKGNEIAIVLPMKGYADFAEEDPSFFDLVSEALGGPEAFGEMMSDWGSTFHAGETFLVRYLPEASDYGDEE